MDDNEPQTIVFFSPWRGIKAAIFLAVPGLCFFVEGIRLLQHGVQAGATDATAAGTAWAVVGGLILTGSVLIARQSIRWIIRAIKVFWS